MDTKQVIARFEVERQTLALMDHPNIAKIFDAGATETAEAAKSRAALDFTIGRPSAVRAVGAANGRNPVPILVPCHRVIGKDGSLTGYGGGLEVKSILLSIEGIPVTGYSIAKLQSRESRR